MQLVDQGATQILANGGYASTEADVTALAAWLAARPAPVNTAPAPKGSYGLPFPCGSEPD